MFQIILHPFQAKLENDTVERLHCCRSEAKIIKLFLFDAKNHSLIKQKFATEWEEVENEDEKTI